MFLVSYLQVAFLISAKNRHNKLLFTYLCVFCVLLKPALLKKFLALYNVGISDRIFHTQQPYSPPKLFQVNTLNNNTPYTEVQDNRMRRAVTPALHMIAMLLERYYKEECLRNSNQHIPATFLKYHHLEQTICDYMMVAISEDFIFDLSKIAYLIYVIDLSMEAKDDKLVSEEVKPVIHKIFKLINTSIAKGHCYNVIRLAHTAVRYWHLIRPRLSSCTYTDIKKEPLIFENQLVVLHAMPLKAFVLCRFNCPMDEPWQDEIRDNYVYKILRQMCEYTIRVAYGYRQVLLAHKNCYQLGVEALRNIVDTKPCYGRDQAVVIFQALIYTLKDVLMVIKEDEGHIEVAKSEVEFLSTVLVLIGEFIEEFKITWRDCMESICVVGLAIGILSVASWPKKVSPCCLLIKIYLYN